MKRLLMVIGVFFLLTPFVWAEGQFIQKVVDGQTLKTLNGEYVRLIGIDVPPEKAAEAAEFVRSLVSGSVVALEYDVEKTDADGNILAYVWFKFEPRYSNDQVIFPNDFDVHYVVDSEGEGDFFVLLNTTVVKAGYGRPLEALPNEKYAKLIKKLYEERPIETVKVEIESHAKADLSLEIPLQ
ncbi:MAG TPA: hypothetical protein VI749_05635 [Candidatus Omnitrophota bacterium]|nr:hypothetical protein [Candidatus Omnitrophota bacterium]